MPSQRRRSTVRALRAGGRTACARMRARACVDVSGAGARRSQLAAAPSPVTRPTDAMQCASKPKPAAARCCRVSDPNRRCSRPNPSPRDPRRPKPLGRTPASAGECPCEPVPLCRSLRRDRPNARTCLHGVEMLNLRLPGAHLVASHRLRAHALPLLPTGTKSRPAHHQWSATTSAADESPPARAGPDGERDDSGTSAVGHTMIFVCTYVCM
jgi:hypothetical protein